MGLAVGNLAMLVAPLIRFLMLGRFLTVSRFRWACPSGATTDLLPKDRINYAQSFAPAMHVSHDLTYRNTFVE